MREILFDSDKRFTEAFLSCILLAWGVHMALSDWHGAYNPLYTAMMQVLPHPWFWTGYALLFGGARLCGALSSALPLRILGSLFGCLFWLFLAVTLLWKARYLPGAVMSPLFCVTDFLIYVQLHREARNELGYATLRRADHWSHRRHSYPLDGSGDVSG